MTGFVYFPQAIPSLGSEKEELLKGLEILERTQQWFNGRLGQLSAERLTSVSKALFSFCELAIAFFFCCNCWHALRSNRSGGTPLFSILLMGVP